MSHLFEFDAMIHKVEDRDGAYVICHYDIRQLYGKGRMKVHVTFDGVPYDGSIINMGVKDEYGQICYIIGMFKASLPALPRLVVINMTPLAPREP